MLTCQRSFAQKQYSRLDSGGVHSNLQDEGPRPNKLRDSTKSIEPKDKAELPTVIYSETSER